MSKRKTFLTGLTVAVALILLAADAFPQEQQKIFWLFRLDESGRAWGYIVRALENGDKIFARYDGAVLTTVAPDGTRKTTYSGSAIYTGGTGKFRGNRGMERVTAGMNPQIGFVENVVEGEYWMEK